MLILLIPVAIFAAIAILGHRAGLGADRGEELRNHIIALIRREGYRIVRIRGCHDREWSPNRAWPRVEVAYRCDLIDPAGDPSRWIVVWGSARPTRDRYSVTTYRGGYLTFYPYP